MSDNIDVKSEKSLNSIIIKNSNNINIVMPKNKNNNIHKQIEKSHMINIKA